MDTVDQLNNLREPSKCNNRCGRICSSTVAASCCLECVIDNVANLHSYSCNARQTKAGQLYTTFVINRGAMEKIARLQRSSPEVFDDMEHA